MKLWLSPDEELVVVHQTIQSGVIINITAYEVTGDSHRLLVSQDIPVNSDGSINSTRIVVGPALLESVSCQVVSGTVIKGQVAVGAQVRRLSGSQSLLAMVSPIVFPSNNYPAPLLYEGERGSDLEREVLRIVTGTNPAAGAECSDTVPTGVDWRLVGALYTLVTNATAANRRVRLTFSDGTTEFARTMAGSDIPASTTGILNYNTNGGNTTISNGVQGVSIGFFDSFRSGFVIATSTLNIQAGDNFDAPVLLVAERLTLAR